MKKILVRGNIIAGENVLSMFYPLEGNYEAHVGEVDNKDFDLVIEGDLNIKNICVMSSDTKVFATGDVVAYGNGY